MPKRTVVSISENLHSKLKELSKKSHIPLKYLVEEAIKTIIENNKNK